jgi:hypothetical protein
VFTFLGSVGPNGLGVSMARLGQVTVRLDGKKTAVKERVTELYKTLQKPALFTGYTRRYTPFKQDGDRAETLPAENVMVQVRFRELLAQARKSWTELMDGIYTQDLGNTRAKADVVVGDVVLAKDVPVTTLMFLIKQWTDVLSFIQHLPTPDPAVTWVYDSNQGLLKTGTPEQVRRTKKSIVRHIKFEPTDKHPGQADFMTEDVDIGVYEKTDFSGGCPQDVKLAMITRVSAVIEALKVAREAANIATEAPENKIADPIFDYVFAPLSTITA